MSVPSLGAARAARCAGCGTELAPALLSCPACHALVYRELLQALAVEATQRSARGDLVEAKATWQRALTLLPAGTQQHTDIGARMAALDARILEEARTKPPKPGSTGGPPWRRGLAGLGAVLLLMLGKLKFLLLGLSKASTLFSMLAFFGVYWTQFGWPLAAGLVVSIYIHEMGHVAALHRAGVPASAPLFIPGLGAIVRLRQHIQDASVNAMIGLAGPLWGLGAAVVAWAVYLATGQPVWGAIAHLGAYLNLFNLIPVWQLDGARGMDALNRWQRAVVVVVIAITFALTREKLLVIIGAVALYHVVRAPEREGDMRMMALFAALVAALGAMATIRL
jgi:Zn-dependent protease